MNRKIIYVISLFLLVLFIVGCGHEHTWKEATCTEPKTCTECGETEGEALGHTWEEATCTEPRHCSICGETEGDALGHTKEVGRCSTCGELANPDLCQKIYETMESLSDADGTAYDATDVDFSSLAVAYTASTLAQPYLDKVSGYCGDLIDLCGDYDELKSLKSAAEELKKNVPTRISGNDQKTLESWYGKYANHCKASADLYEAYADFLETLKSN